MRVLPCPYAGALVAFGDGAVRGDICVDELNVAVIGLGFFINEPEHTLGARHSHYHGVKLLADLDNRLREALVEGKESDQGAQGEPGGFRAT